MLILLGLGTMLLWTRWAGTGRRIVLIAAVLLAITGLSPLGHALMLPLEDRFQRPNLLQIGAPEGIIVLGGAQNMTNTEIRKAIAVNEAGERLIEAAVLARRFPGAKILFSGGSNALLGSRKSEAEGAAQIFQSLGISASRLLLEEESRNTFQNATYSKKRVSELMTGNWLLVTSANHMPRAMGAFRKSGFDVLPWPVDFRTRGQGDQFHFFSKPSGGWRRVDIAVREWAGLLVYRLTGRMDTLFPGPH